MNKKAQISIGDAVSLGFGGIFALATVVLAHLGSMWGFATFFVALFAWFINFDAAMTIASVFAISFFAELAFKNYGLAILWLVFAVAGFFIPNLLRR